MDTLLKFLFPADLASPDSCGRLEIFGMYGPTDEEGKLRGGRGGAHIHQHSEISSMIKENCREALFILFKREYGKDRSAVECIVDTLLPTALAQRYTELEVRQFLSAARRYPETGRLMFDMDFKDLVKEIQRKRLRALAKRAMGGKPIAPPKERPLVVPFQSRPAYALTEITRKKKLTPQEEPVKNFKRMHAYSTLVAGLEDQQLAEQVKMNSIMCRDVGRLDDRWDRYCALRRTGRSSYVGSRNAYRFNPSMDCGLGNKHPGISSLLTASCGGSSAAALLGAS
jgi:hypothetical protein